MKRCKNCRFGDPAKDGEVTFYLCRFMPPRADGTVPAMQPIGWCGQFKLALWRWLGNFGRRGI